jgi:hypothetical protein
MPSFGFKDKMQALMKGKLPEFVTREAMRMLQESESKSKYRKMVLPGKCVWLMQKDAKYVVACPEDPTFISSQPMFMGTTWLLDHSLTKYKAALEGV